MFNPSVAGRNRMDHDSSFTRVPSIGSDIRTNITFAGPSQINSNTIPEQPTVDPSGFDGGIMPEQPVVDPVSQANLQSYTNAQAREHGQHHISSSSLATNGSRSNHSTPTNSALGGNQPSFPEWTYRLDNYRSHWSPTHADVITHRAGFGHGTAVVNDAEWFFATKSQRARFNTRVREIERGGVIVGSMTKESRNQLLCLYKPKTSQETSVDFTHSEEYMEEALRSKSQKAIRATEGTV